MNVMTMNQYLENLAAQEEPWEQDWAVSKDGDIKHKETGYYIAAFRLGRENWLGHMANKRWVDFNTFIPAYIEACHRAGVTTVAIAYE